MYKKFKIKSTDTQNDVLSMSEIIKRRLLHKEWEYPDLLFIDGGINQLNSVKKVLDELDIKINIFGMYKDDKHRTKGLIDINKNEILLDKKLLNFVTFLQDETHRFVIKYHRSLRDKMNI